MLDTGASETALYDHEPTRELRKCLVRLPGRHYSSYYYRKVSGANVMWPNLRIQDLRWDRLKAVMLVEKHQESAPGQGILSLCRVGDSATLL